MARKKVIEDQINGFLRVLEANNISIYKAILFGSMAKGNPHKYSDIDLAIWSPSFGQNFFENIEKTLKAKRQYQNIEIHPFPENENADANSFIHEIEKTGILITPLVPRSLEGFKFQN